MVKLFLNSLLDMTNLYAENFFGQREALALLGFGIFFVAIIGVGLYVYLALTWMTIAKKMGYKKAWLAWIPVANFFLLPILAKKHWGWGFFIFIPFVNLIFIVLWLWKIYELRGYPGTLSLIVIGHIIPVISFFALITNLILFGMLAWGKRGRQTRNPAGSKKKK